MVAEWVVNKSTCKAYNKNTIPNSLNNYCENSIKNLAQTLIFIINGPLFGWSLQ